MGFQDEKANVVFYPMSGNEIAQVQNPGVNPRHRDYDCCDCGQSTNGRVLLKFKRTDGSVAFFCTCSCPKEEPAILLERGDKVVSQLPEAREFQAGENWPPDLSQLFEEAAKAYAAGAYTASAMVSRKVLMACACHEGDADGKQFAAYVDYIINQVLTFPKAKTSIDNIRNIGNEANHTLRFVNRDDAKRALSIVTYMLNTIYSLPSA